MTWDQGAVEYMGSAPAPEPTGPSAEPGPIPPVVTPQTIQISINGVVQATAPVGTTLTYKVKPNDKNKLITVVVI